jgi:hypothetical protein
MADTIKNILTTCLQIITGLFMFLAIFLPLVSVIKKMIKEKKLEAEIKTIKLSFLFLYSAIISFTTLLIIQNPESYILWLFQGSGLAVFLTIFYMITKAQIKMFK